MDDEQPWDRAALAVYADHLTAAGDPRGELIALELEIEDYGTTIEIDARRRALAVAMVGGDPERLARSYVRHRTRSSSRLSGGMFAAAEDRLLHAALFRRLRFAARLDAAAVRALARFERMHVPLPPSLWSLYCRRHAAELVAAAERELVPIDAWNLVAANGWHYLRVFEPRRGRAFGVAWEIGVPVADPPVVLEIGSIERSAFVEDGLAAYLWSLFERRSASLAHLT